MKEVAAAWINRADHRESKTETVPIWPKFLFGSAKKMYFSVDPSKNKVTGLFYISCIVLPFS